MFDPGQIVNIDQLVASKVSITKLTTNKNGKGRSAYLNYGGKKFSLAIIDTRFPFGVGKKMEDDEKENTNSNARDQWTLQIEPNADQIKIMESLDDFILHTINTNASLRQDLLGAADDDDPVVSLKLLKSKYTSLLKYSKIKGTSKRDDRYPPKLRCNITNKDDGFLTQFFRPGEGGRSDPITVDNIPDSENHIASLLRGNCTGSVLLGLSLWATGTGFGVTMRAIQIKAEPRAGAVASGTCLLDSMLGGGASSAHQTEDPVDLELGSEDVDDQLEALEDEEEALEDEEEIIEEEVVAPPPPPPKPAAKAAPARRVVKKPTE